MIDYVIRNARVHGRDDAPADIGFEKGRIAAVEPNLVCDAPSYDAAGCLCCGGLIETHIHLDKSRIIDRCAPEKGRDHNAMKRVSDVKHTMTVEDVTQRARETLEGCIKHGTTRMRTHVEVDPLIGLRGVEGVQALVDEYKWAIDIELCVMPQEGLTNNPGTDELMVESLKRGAKAVGAAPNYDTDHDAQIRRVFEMAREFDVDIDMHLDFGTSPEQSGLRARVRVDRDIQMGRSRRDRARDQALDHGCAAAEGVGAAPRRRGCRRDGPAGDRPVPDGARARLQCAARAGRREPVCRMRLQLLAVEQQHHESVHAIRKRLAHPHDQPACEHAADRAGGAHRRVLRDGDHAFGEADEPAGLRHQGRQSRRRDRARSDEPAAGGRRVARAASPCSSAASAR